MPMYLPLTEPKGFSIKVILRSLVQPSLSIEPKQVRAYYRLLPLSIEKGCNSELISRKQLTTTGKVHDDTAEAFPAKNRDPMIGPDGTRYRNFEDAREFIHRLNLYRAQWPEWRDGPKRPVDIPSNPDIVYRSLGEWVDWGDWLGVTLRPNHASNSRNIHHNLDEMRNGKRSRENITSFLASTHPFRVRLSLPSKDAEQLDDTACKIVLDTNSEFEEDSQRLGELTPSKVDGKNLFELKLLSSFEPLIYEADSLRRLDDTFVSKTVGSPSGSPSGSPNAYNAEKNDEIVQEMYNLQYQLKVKDSESRRIADVLFSRVKGESQIIDVEERKSSMQTVKDILQKYNQLVAEEHRNLAALQRRAEEDMDANCAVCGSGEVGPSNQIVFCEYCNIAVHQHCYGVQTIPDGDWFCHPCTAVVPEDIRKQIAASTSKESQPVICVLCPAKIGAVFPSDDPTAWVHTMCADAAGLQASLLTDFPQIGFRGNSDPLSANARVKASPLLGVSMKQLIKATSQKAGSKRCMICDDASNSVVSCSWQKCNNSVHISCALSRGCDVRCDPTSTQREISKYSLSDNTAWSSTVNSPTTVSRPRYPLIRSWTVFCPDHSQLSTSGGDKIGVGCNTLHSTDTSANNNFVPGTSVRGPSADGSWFLPGEDRSQRAKELDAIGVRSCHLCRVRKLETVMCSLDSRKCRTAYCRQHVERLGISFDSALRDEKWQCFKCQGLCPCNSCLKVKNDAVVESIGGGFLSATNGEEKNKSSGYKTSADEEDDSTTNDTGSDSKAHPQTHDSMFSVSLQELRFNNDGARCGVCGNFGSTDSSNSILCCRACGVFVHDKCLSSYGKSRNIGNCNNGSFVCDICCDSLSSEEINISVEAHQEVGTINRVLDMGQHCQICPVPQGFRIKGRIAPDSTSTFYMHGACFRAVREQKGKISAIRSGCDIDQTAVCCACGFGEGIVMQCQEFGCSRSFHVLCALQAGFEPNKCHIHTAPGRLQARILSRLLGPGHTESQRYHSACAIITELTWAHLPFAGQVPSRPLIELADRLRQQKYPSVAFNKPSHRDDSFGLALLGVLTGGLSIFADLKPEQAVIVAKTLHEVYVETPEPLLVKERAVPILRCSICDKPNDGRYCFEVCAECKSIFHPICDGWRLHMDTKNQKYMCRGGK